MATVDSWQLWVRRAGLTVAGPRPAADPALAPGAVRLAVEKFALTMNVVTVNALATSRRNLPCSGGSRESNDPGWSVSSGRILGISAPTTASLLNLRSASTVRVSAYLVTSQPSCPYGSRSRATGSAARRRA